MPAECASASNSSVGALSRDNVGPQIDQRPLTVRRVGLAQCQPVATPPVIAQGGKQMGVADEAAGIDVEHDIFRRQSAALEDRLIDQPVLALHRQQVARMYGQLQIAAGIALLCEEIERMQGAAQAVEVDHTDSALSHRS